MEIYHSDSTLNLSRLVKKGELERPKRGVYTSDGVYDDDFYIQRRYKKAIFSYFYALTYHYMTDYIPRVIDITLPCGYNPHSLPEYLKPHYVSKEILNLGVIEMETSFGNIVKVYDMERTICDFIKNKNKIPAEEYSKTINRYMSGDKNIEKLLDYAAKMKITKKVNDLLSLFEVK